MSTSAGARLRELLDRPTALITPGVVSPIFATLAERAGFETVYATGAGVSNALLGLPDLGLMGMTEMANATSNIVDAVSIPVIADIDTGYGSALNVTRTVKTFLRAGVGGIQMEDQINPKRCGHFENKAVVSTDEMVERVLAAVEARGDDELVIIARTDAISTEGLSSAIARSHRYVEAGADVVFIEAPTTVEDLRTIGREFSVPLVANLVEGGKTPLLPMDELSDMGFKIVLFANAILRMVIASADRALHELRETGTTNGMLEEMATWEQRQKSVDLNEWLALDDTISARAQKLMASPLVKK